MRKLKLFFACLLMAVLSIGQVWGADVECTLSNANIVAAGDAGSSYSSYSLTDGCNQTWGAYAIKNKHSNATSSYHYLQIKKYASNTAYYLQVPSKSGYTIKTITMVVSNTNSPNTGGGNSATLFFSASNSTSSAAGEGVASGTGASSVTIDCSELELTTGYITASAAVRIWGDVTVTYTPSSGPAIPSVTVNPASWDFGEVASSASASKEFSVSGSNLTSGQNLALTVPEGFSVSPTSITVSAATLAATAVTVSKNTTTIDDYSGNLSITGGGLTSAKTVALEMSVVADPEPTGTFNLFSGDLAEGDYVLVYATYNNAMKASQTANSNRMDYMVVSPAENKLENPDASIVWHIAPISETSYWTIYSEDASKYIGSTNSNNQAKLLDGDITDAMKWTVSTGTGVYDFVNVARQAANGNPYLRNNDNGTNHYGFACYANGTGGALTLYKKDDGKPAAPTFTPAAGSYLEAQSVTISAAADVDEIRYTLDGSAPTATSTLYTGAIPVNSTTTIKAIAVKDAVVGHVASAKYTITTPLTVAAAIALIPNNNDQVDDQFVEGYVCTAAPEVLSGGKMTYYISADGTEANRLQIYKGKNLNNTEFSAVGDLTIGDKVVVFGQLKNFSGTPEMNDGNYIVRRTAKGALSSVVVSGTPTKTAYSSGDAFDPAGLVVTATYASGYAINVASELAAADWSASPATVTAEGDINVTATYGGTTSAAYPVHVTILAATLDHISLSYDAVEVYQGKPLPKPVVTAHWSDNTESDVTALATFSGYDKDTPGEQEITVSYKVSEGDDPEEATYAVTVKPIYGVELAASVAKDLIETVLGNNVESTSDMIVRGIVSSVGSISSASLTYFISDDGTTTNQLEIFKGKYLDNADFTNDNKLKVGDEVVVTGKVIYYNGTTAEFANGKSAVTSLARTPNFEIADIASFEVGSADLAVADLTITQDGEGAVTLASSDHTEYVSIVDGKLRAVAAGDATITANLAANGIYKAASTTFDVHVIAATIKYAITFDGNGGSGDAPEFAAETAAGAEVTLPANSYTYTGHNFTGWKVYDENEDEVTVTAGVFEMPASPVTIKAQWAEIPVWAYTYTSNVAISSNTAAHVTIGGTDYDAAKTSKGASATITLPQGVTTIHLHLVAWKDEAQTVTVSGACFNEDKELTIIANDGVSGGGTTYDLGESGVDYYFSLTPDKAVAANEVITISAAGNKRFVLFGVNQEGGVLPVLDHIAISGTMTNTTGWKTGDEITPEGLTVNAIYTLNNVEQDPVDVTSSVVWSHAALVEDQTEVTLTATYTEGEVVKSANANVTIAAVETGDPTIITNPTSYLNFGASVEQGAVVAPKTITVTLKNITGATATLGGTNFSAFSIDDTEIVDGDVITVSVNTGTPGVYAGTVTIKDNDSETQKVINLSMTVVEPEVPETAVATDSKWVVATAADLVDGAEVLITGVKNAVTFAMGVDRGNNRAAVAGTLDDDVFTPGVNTMSFILVAQEEGKFALRASNGKYLYAAHSSNNYLKTRAAIEDGNAKWTLTATSAIANGSNTNETIRFNSSNNPEIFSCYADETKQADIQFYVPYVAPVAQIEKTGYTTLAAAVAAANANDVVKLLANVDVTADGLTIGTNMTLDLNSFNIKAGEQLTNDINVPAGVKLTLVDNSIDADGKIYTEEAYTGSVNGYGVIRVAGEFLMQSGNIYAVIESNPANKGQFAVVIAAGGKVTVEGGQIKAGWYAISNNGNNTGSTIIVSGGELISTADFAIYNPAKESTVTVSGGVVYGAAGGIAMNRGELTVTGGTITSKDQGSTGTWGDGTGGLSNAAISANGKYESVSVEISGGTVTAEGNAIMITNGTTNPVEVAISGGQFSHVVPAEYCAEGFAPVTTPNAQGKYEVEEAPFVQVRNGLQEGWYYTMCLNKAVTAVQGGTIWRVLSKAENGKDIILEEVIGTLEAGRPYIFNASAETLEVQYHGNEVQNPVTTGNNGLVGSFSQEPIDNVNTNYILYNNALYYVNTSNVYVGAYRAYLNMLDVPAYGVTSQAPGRRVTMTVHGEQTATDIDALNASETPVKVLRDGQIFILRGEKMYNVNGQVVK